VTDVLDQCITVFISIITIYVKTEEMHDILLKVVITKLGDNQLFISPEISTSRWGKVSFAGIYLPQTDLKWETSKSWV
jgi:hypothetical protein